MGGFALIPQVVDIVQTSRDSGGRDRRWGPLAEHLGPIPFRG